MEKQNENQAGRPTQTHLPTMTSARSSNPIKKYEQPCYLLPIPRLSRKNSRNLSRVPGISLTIDGLFRKIS